MENYLCPLKSVCATLLSSSSTSWVTETVLSFVCGVGLFLLLLPYLQSNPSIPLPEKNRNIKKSHQSHVETKRRSRRKNKTDSVKACVKKLEETRGLIALLQNLLTKLPGEGGFSQKKYVEPSGLQHRRKPAKANHRWPCGEQCAGPVRGAATLAPRSTAIAPPSNAPSHQTSTIPAKPPEDTVWETDSGNPHNLEYSDPQTTGLSCSRQPILALSSGWTAANSLYFPTWKHCGSQQEQTSHQPSKASFWGGFMDRRELHKDLEIEIAKRAQLKAGEEKEKDRSFEKHRSPDCHLNSLGILDSLSRENTTTVSQPYWSKPEQVARPQHFIYSKDLGNHLYQKCKQFFWGHPSLHSESLMTIAWVPGRSSPLQSPPVLFNSTPNTCLVQISVLCSRLQPLPHHKAQPLAPALAPVLTQACLPSSFPVPTPDSAAQTRAYGKSCPNTPNEGKSPTSTEIQHQESLLLQKQLQNGRALPCVAKRSQETFSPLISNLSQVSWASEACKSHSTLSEEEHQKQLAYHPEKRLTQHKRTLPSGTQESLDLTQPQGKLSGTGHAKDQHGQSRPSMFAGETSQDVKVRPSCIISPEHLQLGKDLDKDLGQVPEYGIFQGSEKSPVQVLPTASDKEVRSDWMSSGSTKGDYIPRNLDKKQLENTLKVHLGRELGKIIESQIPVGRGSSRHTVNHTLPKSDTHKQNGNTVTSQCQAYHVDTTQEFSLPTPGTRQAPEAHIEGFLEGHKWDPSVQAGEPMNLNLSEIQSLPLSQDEFQSSATPESWTGSRAEAAKTWGQNPQEGWREKATPKKSCPTLENPFPAPSPISEEGLAAVRHISSDNDPGPSETTECGQEESQPLEVLTPITVSRAWESRTVLGDQRGSLGLTPSQSITGKGPGEESSSCSIRSLASSVTRLKMSYESQSSSDKETKEAVVAEQSSVPELQDTDVLMTSVLAKSPHINMDLRSSGAPGASKNPFLPRACVHYPGKRKPRGGVLSEELPVELETETQPQGCHRNVLLQDCATERIIQGLPIDRPHVSDILASHASRCHLKGTSSSDTLGSTVINELIAATGRSSGLHDPKILKLQGPCRSQSTISAPTDERKSFRRHKRKNCEEGLKRLGSSPDSGISQPALDRKLIEFSVIKSPKDYRKKRMTNFIESPGPNKKDKGPKVQNKGPVKSKSMFMDRRAREVQTVTTAIGQILGRKLRLQQGSYDLKINQRTKKVQESWDLVYWPPSYHRAPSYPEQRREMSDTICHQQATPEGQSSIRTNWTHEGCRNPYTMVKFKISDRI